MGDSGTGPATPFELVADETRLGILRALAEHRRERGPDEWPTFAELRKRAGVGDASNFNYHLDRLCGRFVEKNDGAYRLTYQGHSVVSSLLAGTYETDTSVELSVDSDCPFCGESQRGSFEAGTATITCPNDHSFTQELPPGTAADRSPADLRSLVAVEMRTNVQFVLEGVCPLCYGELDTQLTDAEGVEGVENLFVADCTQCGQRFGGPPAFLAVTHPAFVSFYHDRGIDVSDEPYWTLPFPDHEVEVASESPTRVRVTARSAVSEAKQSERGEPHSESGRDELRITMDGSADVIDVERT